MLSLLTMMYLCFTRNNWYYSPMAKPIKKKFRPKPRRAQSSTVLKAYRFKTHVIQAFEHDCARHLRNPKLVIEALITHWLAVDVKEQLAIAKRVRGEIANNE
jgi:hypothetical protein